MPPMPPVQPSSVSEYIDAIRAALVCDRCGRYIGSLAATRYLPPPYAVVVDPVTSEARQDDVASLIAFEWYMVGRLRDGNFTLRHPQAHGRCVSVKEWLEAEDDEVDDEERESDSDEPEETEAG